MAKNAICVIKLDVPIQREKGYFYFVNGADKGTIDGIYKTSMQHGRTKKSE